MITRFSLITLALLSLSAVVHAEEVALSADYLEGWWSLDGKEGCNVIDTRYVLFRDNGTVESGRGTVPNVVGYWSVVGDALIGHTLQTPVTREDDWHPFVGKGYRYERMAPRVTRVTQDAFDVELGSDLEMRQYTLTRCR